MSFKRKYPADFWKRVYRAYTRKDKKTESYCICGRSRNFQSLWEDDNDKGRIREYADLFLKQHPKLSKWRPGYIYLFYTYGANDARQGTNIRLKFLKWMIENI